MDKLEVIELITNLFTEIDGKLDMGDRKMFGPLMNGIQVKLIQRVTSYKTKEEKALEV